MPLARGNTDSDFAIQLPYPITVSGKCYLDCVLLNNSFYSVRSNDNDKIYLDETSARVKRVATIAAGQNPPAPCGPPGCGGFCLQHVAL